MCTSPLSIPNRSAYFHGATDFVQHIVPCCKCDECRSVLRSEWEVRISFELAYYKEIGGIAVFLTFTYNNKHLPWLHNEDDKENPIHVPCFDGNHILGFLDRLNNTMQYIYGKRSYKYFIAAEYGKNTRRPHYHGLFFLRPDVKWRWFVEYCRELWSNYGYMFPKYSTKRDMWLDNYGKPSTPLLKGFDPESGVPLYAGARYVSKYVCKDISYFELNPTLNKACQSKQFRKTYAKQLPKHWQSNGIGYSLFFHKYNLSDCQLLDDIITNGVPNPLDPTADKIPVPQYIVNKFMYVNVKSTRISPTTGKFLYDRKLSVFGEAYLPLMYWNKVEKTSAKISKIFQMKDRYTSKDSFHERLDELGITNLADTNQLRPLAIYHVLLKHLSPCAIRIYHEDCPKANIFDFYGSLPLYIQAKDYSSNILARKWNITEEYNQNDIDYCDNLFWRYAELDRFYCDLSRELALYRSKLFKVKEEERQRYRYVHKYVYDKQLC